MTDDRFSAALGDAHHALLQLPDRRLPDSDWSTVSEVIDAMRRALAAGDSAAFETALEELSIAMPSRNTRRISVRSGDDHKSPPPEDLLDRTNALIHEIVPNVGGQQPDTHVAGTSTSPKKAEG